MKKKLFYYLFAVLCTATLFTSCSDDDDEVKYPIDTELAGGYVGNLSVNVDGNQMGTTENQKSQFHSLIRKLTKLHYH